MSEGKEGPCGTAQLLEDILRACFGTILVEPIKWRIVSTATPYRSMLRNVTIAALLLHRSTLHCYSAPWQTATP